MPFIGNQPALSYTSFAKQDFTTSATTSYTLDNPVANANELALFINFVRQEPTAAYAASGTTLTLTSATASSDDMYCVYLGQALQTVNPPNVSVGTAQLIDGAVTSAKLGIGATNTPAFHATSSTTNITNGAAVTVINGTEDWDTDNLYNPSNGRFTVTDSTTGYYYFYAAIGFEVITANRMQIGIRYNDGTSDIELLTNETQSDTSGYPSPTISGVIPLLTSGHYAFVKGYQNSGGTIALSGELNKNFFGAYKIIGL